MSASLGGRRLIPTGPAGLRDDTRRGGAHRGCFENLSARPGSLRGGIADVHGAIRERRRQPARCNRRPPRVSAAAVVVPDNAVALPNNAVALTLFLTNAVAVPLSHPNQYKTSGPDERETHLARCSHPHARGMRPTSRSMYRSYPSQPRARVISRRVSPESACRPRRATDRCRSHRGMRPCVRRHFGGRQSRP